MNSIITPPKKKRQAALIGIGITKENDYPCHAVSGTEYFEGTTLGIRIGYEF